VSTVRIPSSEVLQICSSVVPEISVASAGSRFRDRTDFKLRVQTLSDKGRFSGQPFVAESKITFLPCAPDHSAIGKSSFTMIFLAWLGRFAVALASCTGRRRAGGHRHHQSAARVHRQARRDHLCARTGRCPDHSRPLFADTASGPAAARCKRRHAPATARARAHQSPARRTSAERRQRPAHKRPACSGCGC